MRLDDPKYDFLGNLERWQNAFLEEKKANNCSNNTILSYRRILDNFYEYCTQFSDDITLATMNGVVTKGFINLIGQKHAEGTKKTYFTCLKSFLTYISENNEDSIDLTKSLKGIRFKKEIQKIKHLTDAEQDSLFSLIEKKHKTPTFENIRACFLIKLYILTGLRVSEAIGMDLRNWEYLEDTDCYLFVIVGKGNKEANIYIAKENIEFEYNWFMSNKIYTPVVTKNGRDMSRVEIFYLVNSFFKQAKVGKTGVHILRHTYAMNLASEGIDIADIQTAMRHANILTTMIYRKTTQEKLANIAKNVGRN